jgi:hypothetical protein
MFGYKSAKDRLIDQLQSDLERERVRVSQLEAELEKAHETVLETVATASVKRPPMRTMRARCDELTKRSLKNAIARDPKRNLVAEQPPPGAVPTGVTLE